MTKPFKPHDLHGAVEQFLRQPEKHRPRKDEATSANENESLRKTPVDLEGFRSVMREAGVEEVVPVTLTTYLAEAQSKIDAILDAVKKCDGQAIDKAAHALKSASGAIRADRLAQLLQQLEDAGGDGNIRQAQELLESVKREYDQVVSYLRHQMD